MSTLTLADLGRLLATVGGGDPVAQYRGKVVLRLTDYCPPETCYALDTSAYIAEVAYRALPGVDHGKPFTLVAHPDGWAALRRLYVEPADDTALAEILFAMTRARNDFPKKPKGFLDFGVA